jgi:hypothetical protein
MYHFKSSTSGPLRSRVNEKGEKEEKSPRLLGAGKGIWIHAKAGNPARRRDGKRRKSQFFKNSVIEVRLNKTKISPKSHIDRE